MKQQNKNQSIKNHVPNRGKIVYGLQQFSNRTVKFFNCFSGKEGLDSVHTSKDNPLQNYHFWLIDKKTGKLIDPTPPQMDAIPDATPIYIPWSEEEQKEQKTFLLTVRMREVSMLGMTLHEWINKTVEDKDFRQIRCFQNCFAIHNYYKGKYELVCGSMGWIVGENTRTGNIDINMDWGW
jgi:hypothetical protein